MRLPLMMPSNLKSEDVPVPETAAPKSTGDAFRKAEHESMLRPQRWWPPRQLSRVIS